ncbi:MAG: hypothetical protein Ta2E_11110 [Mycoplasmoidaceae bacterium]|nr:MAG: hypothetical protein Ta2E_11110 [Mycoplasmoidaceae bacterium]
MRTLWIDSISIFSNSPKTINAFISNNSFAGTYSFDIEEYRSIGNINLHSIVEIALSEEEYAECNMNEKESEELQEDQWKYGTIMNKQKKEIGNDNKENKRKMRKFFEGNKESIGYNFRFISNIWIFRIVFSSSLLISLRFHAQWLNGTVILMGLICNLY